MGIEETYKQLNSKMMLPDSVNLTAIWKMICTDEEAGTALILPADADEISMKTGKAVDDVSLILQSMFRKGVVFKSVRDGKTQFKLAKNIIQFHDSSLLWDNATPEFFELWKKVMDEDFTGMMKSMPETFKLPSFMRVIPIHETLETRNTVLSYEECARMVEESEKIAVVKCPCRLSQKNCGSPLEACIQLNRGAEYALDRGHGRKISKQEALDILKKSEDAGLVHMTENRVSGNVICNCCSCCCEMFRLMKYSGKKWILSPSRFVAVVSAECTSCGACVEICPVETISVGDIAVVNADTCLGCGLCATVCPVDAIKLNQARTEEHIPIK
jgi:ferredoxin